MADTFFYGSLMDRTDEVESSAAEEGLDPGEGMVAMYVFREIALFCCLQLILFERCRFAFRAHSNACCSSFQGDRSFF